MEFIFEKEKLRYFKLFACCYIIKGSSRATICDTQREAFHIIPNDLYDIISNNTTKTIEYIFNIYEEKNREILLNYFSFLLKNEYIFFCGSLEELYCFPEIESRFEDFRIIKDAIIEVNEKSSYDINDVSNQLDNLLCKEIEIRFYDIVTLSFVSNFILAFKGTSVENIKLYLPYINAKSNEVIEFLQANIQVETLCFFNSPEPKLFRISEKSLTRVIYSSQIITNNSHCGQISPHYFSSNLPTILESLSFNTCLNRKVTISVDGTIKNCPSTNTIFGNIKYSSLRNVINTKSENR